MPLKSHGEAQQGIEADNLLSRYIKDVKTPQKGSGKDFRLKPFRPLEVDEQIAVFKYAEIQARADPRWGMLFSIPNGKAASSIREAVKAKHAGLKRGVPDMFLPWPAGGWHGLFIEVKRADGTKSDLKPDQVSWIVKLQAAGYQTVVAFGWKEAVAEIAGYLGDEDDRRRSR
jgi:hypothetical protein